VTKGGVITGTPIDLSRLIESKHPIRHVRYELEEVWTPTIADVMEPIVAQAEVGRAEAVVAG
jgi:predicted GTPase